MEGIQERSEKEAPRDGELPPLCAQESLPRTRWWVRRTGTGMEAAEVGLWRASGFVGGSTGFPRARIVSRCSSACHWLRGRSDSVTNSGAS